MLEKYYAFLTLIKHVLTRQQLRRRNELATATQY